MLTLTSVAYCNAAAVARSREASPLLSPEPASSTLEPNASRIVPADESIRWTSCK